LYTPFTEKPEQIRSLQVEVGYWPALALGGAAQLAPPTIARTNGLWIRSLQLDRPTYDPASHSVLWQ